MVLFPATGQIYIHYIYIHFYNFYNVYIMIYIYIYIYIHTHTHTYMNEKRRDMKTVDSCEDIEELLKEDCFFLQI